ncbi:hypothetical protein CMUST_08790 [Corynebacterium mustelae]|uniref:Uncharacterized protein n=1 Tax=Corynebacterium mustelae TaxID=571915 RepID=A0A0G3H4M0_9CORY|nr:hypothetical protein [Corynebacterium mustelae]AKK06082.1 hypothetical protein CMUST_08790 [Corynebacterium mustelae]
MGTIIAVIIAVIVTAAVFWASSTAQRLHRLHVRTDAARLALQAALDRRAAVLAAVDPTASAMAHSAESVMLEYDSFSHRAEKEREITAAIAALGPQPPISIVEAEARLQLAHRFYNDAVSDTRALRVRPAVRLLRLGGTARLPEYFELTM